MSDIDTAGARRRNNWKIVVLSALGLVVVTSPFALLGLAFWAADGSWEFAGGGFRHWVFIRGSTVDRLGFVAASGHPVRYVVRLAEGTDPGAVTTVYDSEAMPEHVTATSYARKLVTAGIGKAAYRGVA